MLKFGQLFSRQVKTNRPIVSNLLVPVTTTIRGFGITSHHFSNLKDQFAKQGTISGYGYKFSQEMKKIEDSLYKKIGYVEEEKKCGKALIVDVAGTITSDFSTWALIAFKQVLSSASITSVTWEQMRAPMGIPKCDHFMKLFEHQSVRDQWYYLYGKYPDLEDAKRLTLLYNILHVESKYSDISIGTKLAIDDVVASQGFKIGVTTGFERKIAEKFLEPAMMKFGLKLHSIVTSDEIKHGRPYPDGVYKNLQQLGIDRNHQESNIIVKVDDTNPGIAEGMGAGAITVGVWQTSAYLGFNDPNDHKHLDNEELKCRALQSITTLSKSQPHFMVPDIQYVPGIIRYIRYTKGHGINIYRLPKISDIDFDNYLNICYPHWVVKNLQYLIKT